MLQCTKVLERIVAMSPETCDKVHMIGAADCGRNGFGGSQMNVRRSVVVAVVAVALALGWSMLRPVAAGPVITKDALEAGMSAGSIVLVDVREADEFVAGHVPGAINLPLSGLTAAALPAPAGKTVVVMCRSGNRSSRAQAIAVAGGRADVVNYSGSMNEWSARGGAIVTGR